MPSSVTDQVWQDVEKCDLTCATDMHTDDWRHPVMCFPEFLVVRG